MKTVLLAEDNDDDIVMMKIACERAGIPHSLRVVTDGAHAVEYLSGSGDYHDRIAHPQPDLVFLDIAMPKVKGHDVLAFARTKPLLKNVPVIMLTNSSLPADINRAYDLRATSYLPKMSDLTVFSKAIRIILRYWLEINICPG